MSEETKTNTTQSSSSVTAKEKTVTMRLLPPENRGRELPRPIVLKKKPVHLPRTGKYIDVDQLIESRNAKQEGSGVIQDLSVEDRLLNVNQHYDEIQAPFAEGGQAKISKARDRGLKRVVALKALKHELLKDETIKGKFIREAQITGQLDHPSIMPVYTLSNDDNKDLYLAMKLIPGLSLNDRIKKTIEQYEKKGIKAFDEKKARIRRLHYFLKVCDAISYAHSRKVLHGDLKPDNIMIGEYHEVYVMDWGIARRIQEDGTAENIDAPGTISGTPKYISPEAVSGKPLDCRSDIFSLGLILFELVTLSPGTVGDDSKAIMLNIRDGILSPVKHRFGFPIDRDLTEIIKKATAIDREERYQTADELAEDIRRWLAGNMVLAHPLSTFSRAFRWCTSHLGWLTACGMIMLILAIGAYTLETRIRSFQSKKAVSRDKVIAFAAVKMIEAGNTIERTVLQLINTVGTVADKSHFLVIYGTPVKNGTFIQALPGSDKLKPVPEDYQWSESYHFKISKKHFNYIFSKGANLKEAEEFLSKIHPMNEEFRKTLFGEKERNNQEEGQILKRIFTGFENGLYISYPAEGGYAKDFDHRVRPWYTTVKKKNAQVWSEPYIALRGQGVVVTYAAPIMHDGKFIGATGLDFSLAELDQLIMKQGNTADYVSDKFLITFNGQYLTGNAIRNKYFNTKTSKTVFDILKEKDTILFQHLNESTFGRFIREENGRQVLYLHMKLHNFKAIYVEKIDLEKLREHCMAK